MFLNFGCYNKDQQNCLCLRLATQTADFVYGDTKLKATRRKCSFSSSFIFNTVLLSTTLRNFAILASYDEERHASYFQAIWFFHHPSSFAYSQSCPSFPFPQHLLRYSNNNTYAAILAVCLSGLHLRLSLQKSLLFSGALHSLAEHSLHVVVVRRHIALTGCYWLAIVR